MSHSPALTEGREPTTATGSRWPLALTFRTAKPFSSLKKVTRSIKPDKLSAGARACKETMIGRKRPLGTWLENISGGLASGAGGGFASRGLRVGNCARQNGQAASRTFSEGGWPSLAEGFTPCVLDSSAASAKLEQAVHRFGFRATSFPSLEIGSPQQMQTREFIFGQLRSAAPQAQEEFLVFFSLVGGREVFDAWLTERFFGRGIWRGAGIAIATSAGVPSAGG
ncbi:hypothetical protein SBV1_820018 [Verrucomicrobia bacterium]|nr:hypothetical protein SBV1_820018 [Verrucomicrobiota bacterium]